MNIYTTNLNGEKISKNDALIHLEGTLDELNAHLGLIKARISDSGDRDFIESIQTALMKLMAHASSLENEMFFITDLEITALSQKINDLQPFCATNFTLPGKSCLEAQIHIARTVARRAERCFIAAATAVPAAATAVPAAAPLNPQAGQYLNSLSNYLFALACKEAAQQK